MSADAKSGAVTSDANKLTYLEGHLELTMYRASGIRFIDRARWQVDDPKTDFKMKTRRRRFRAELRQEGQHRAKRRDEVSGGAAASVSDARRQGGRNPSTWRSRCSVRSTRFRPTDRAAGHRLSRSGREAYGLEIWRETAGVPEGRSSGRRRMRSTTWRRISWRSATIEIQEVFAISSRAGAATAIPAATYVIFEC